jgi:Carboxypeptidase regulatory-like domain
LDRISALPESSDYSSLCPFTGNIESVRVDLQYTGIAGRIRDGNGTAVASVVVTVTQTDSGLKRMVLSNGQGHYTFVRLPSGDYRVEAVKPGFKPLLRSDVHVGPNQTITVDLNLRLGNSAGSRHRGYSPVL